MLKYYLTLLPEGVGIVFMSFLLLFLSGTSVKAQKTQPKGSDIVFLITTPNMKVSGSDRSDYDRLKAALSKEFNSKVGRFNQSKLSFILFTYSDDESKVLSIEKKVMEIIPDAKIERMTFEELKKLRN